LTGEGFKNSFVKYFKGAEMTVRIVVGAQFGDEGKGKIVDFFSEKADMVVRFNGGNNAGHTVVVKDKTFKFHLMPSGAVQGKKCLIGAGVAIDPRVLKQELADLKKAGKSFDLSIDERTHIIMPYHKELDEAKEKAKGRAKIGTTKRGIGPCYSDRVSRVGITFSDFIDPARLKARLSIVFPGKKKILKEVYDFDSKLTEQEIFKEYSALGKELKKFAGDVSLEVNSAINAKKEVLLEGAQGTFLDTDFGTYPFVTSSHPISGAALTGIGLGLNKINECIGVVKAYSTRVGSGPFPTELSGELAEKIREKGAEFGTTTGRPRRVGWLDLAMLRTAQRFNNFTDLAITKLDVLSGLKEIKVCNSVKVGGKELREWPADLGKLHKAKPVYKSFKSFELPEKIEKFDDLPLEAIDYLRFLEGEVGVPIKIVSYSPKRSDTLLLY